MMRVQGAPSLSPPAALVVPARPRIGPPSSLSHRSTLQRAGPAPNPFASERLQSTSSQLFQKRVVRLGGPVTDEACNVLVAQLLYLDAQSTSQDVSLYINSPGGSITAGMAVFDVMRHIRPDVSTVCAGQAASMGAFLLAAGAKGKRFSFPSTRIMIHQPLGGVQGQVDDIEIQANEMLHHKLVLNAYLAEFTGQPLARIETDTQRDFFMNAAEAIEYGMIDAVVTRAFGRGERES